MKIKKLDRVVLKTLGTEIESQLQAIAEQLGLEITYGGGSYADAEATLRLRIKVADPEAKEAARRKEFEQYCYLYGLKPEHFGKEFSSNGKRYRLTGFAMSRSKYPIRATEIATGKEILFTTQVVGRIVG